MDEIRTQQPNDVPQAQPNPPTPYELFSRESIDDIMRTANKVKLRKSLSRPYLYASQSPKAPVNSVARNDNCTVVDIPTYDEEE